MKIIRLEQTTEHKNSASCIATEYPTGEKNINGAIIELTGRYPDTGRVTNLESKELIYVIKGSGRLTIEGETMDLNKGDMVLIEPNEKYFFDGNFSLFSSCTPAWRPDQHKQVD